MRTMLRGHPCRMLLVARHHSPRLPARAHCSGWEACACPPPPPRGGGGAATTTGGGGGGLTGVGRRAGTHKALGEPATRPWEGRGGRGGRRLTRGA